MATCLSIVNSVLGRLGLNTTTAAVGSTDPQVMNVVALCNEEGQELANRYVWTALQNEATFTTLAVEDQGLMDTIAPGYQYVVNDTIWNRSLRRPVFGPQPPAVWQQQKAFAINGPWSNYRIKAGHLYMYPTPVAGQSCYFEYISANWCTDSTGATGREEWGVDTDIPVLDWHLLVLGTIWRWKKLKGFEYAEDFNSYERRVVDAMGRDGGKDTLSLTNTKYDIFPGVVVPSGSWSL
jgi:hypothetical protein